jgi:hypothetical protein
MNKQIQLNLSLILFRAHIVGALTLVEESDQDIKNKLLTEVFKETDKRGEQHLIVLEDIIKNKFPQFQKQLTDYHLLK